MYVYEALDIQEGNEVCRLCPKKEKDWGGWLPKAFGILYALDSI